jgi:hypothetical protein
MRATMLLLGFGASAFVLACSSSGSSSGRGQQGPPVTNAPCANQPTPGQWLNISPPGSNYTKTYTGINAVVVRPDNPAIVYTGADMNGLYKSTDCGGTWTQVNTGTHAADMSSGRPWSMVIDPRTPDVMYVVQGYGTSGLWKSTNAGVDWQQVLTPNVTSAFYAGGQITSISLDPTDPAHIVVESHGNCAAGKTCAAESTDAGATWTLIDMAAVGDWSEGSGIAIVDRKTWLYCGVFAGLFRTADEGTSWQAMDVGGALPSCDYYEPKMWQDAAGRYYLPAIAYTGPGILASNPNDTSSFALLAKSPQADLLVASGQSLIASKQADSSYWIASQMVPSAWQAWTGPPAGAPAIKGNLGGAASYLTYDKVHHLLYVSTFSTGLWVTSVE